MTRSVTLRVRGNVGAGFHGEVSIAREEFGARWNQALETGGFLVGKLVEVELELHASAPRSRAAGGTATFGSEPRIEMSRFPGMAPAG